MKFGFAFSVLAVILAQVNSKSVLDANEALTKEFLFKVPEFDWTEQELSYTVIDGNSSMLPVVVQHGMGDSCFNPGMAQITKIIGQRLGVYSVCYGDGDNQISDTVNGFTVNLDNTTNWFAKKIRTNPKLKNGFHAVGFSQGNVVIRGYIERFNDPPVHTFMSVHGPLAGVGAVPRCAPHGWGIVSKLCDALDKLVGEVAYSPEIQNNLAQSNYLRDPTNLKLYLQHGLFLADINNERSVNAQYKENFQKLESLVLVKAKGDTMIFPRESEWFGFYKDGGFSEVQDMKETRWYKEDLFGLQTVEQAGKIHYETSEGDHLRFSKADLLKWIDTYFK